ncbi:hypothetical protein GCM10023322_64910 [Rugosimonospora acidiphila]|uniref:Uncharacterized protein n=1 Tax=Rugosimonospora acidiphila TaxID=556531 RepID=A0ABP9SJV0_9ACTN
MKSLAAAGVTGVRQAGDLELDRNSMIRGYTSVPVELRHG